MGVARVGGAEQRRVVLRAGELQQRLRAAYLEAVVVVTRGRRGAAVGGHVVQVGAGGHEGLLRGGPRPLAEDGLQVQFAVFARVCSTVGNRPDAASAGSEENYN